MGKMKLLKMKSIVRKHHKVFSILVLSSLLLSKTCISFAEEAESLDINNLRAQLESSRSQANVQKASNSLETTPLDDTKKNLDQEEQALMKKLQNVVPPESPSKEDDLVKEASNEKTPAELTKAKIVSAKEDKKVAKVDSKSTTASSDLSVNSKNTEKLATAETGKSKLNDKTSEVTVVEAVKSNNNDKVNAELRLRVSQLQARLSDKSKELEETRNRLVIAETQVERLSGILEKMNNQKLAGYLTTEPNTATARASGNQNILQHTAPVVNQVSNTKPSEESLVGIVTTQKAFLRSGPSKDDSPIMSVSKGTRLVVETRNDEWYRVITPTGGRAWISTQMLGFGPGAEAGSDSALRVGGYEKTLH